MAFWNRARPESETKRPKPEEKPSPEEKPLMLYASDDLMTRAEKIIYAIGHRGAVGSYVITVYRMLQCYEQIDHEEADATETPNAPPR